MTLQKEKNVNVHNNKISMIKIVHVCSKSAEDMKTTFCETISSE